MKILRKINQTIWIYEDEAGTFVGWATHHKDFHYIEKWRKLEIECHRLRNW